MNFLHHITKPSKASACITSNFFLGIFIGLIGAHHLPCFYTIIKKRLTGVASTLIVGYHKIRGLGAPLRMMCYYKKANFKNMAYGSDMKDTWFGGDKPKFLKSNSCINLPYVVDGDTVVTQSNTCLLYLGKKLGLDKCKDKTHNHTVLDQTMDLRNDLMKIVYPFAGVVKTKQDFPAAAKEHLAGSATTNLTKLEGFCRGTYMCGATPQSGDFALFEMLDQHINICIAVGEPNILDVFPKLKTLHSAMKAEPSLAGYYASDCYANWMHNNGLITHHTGQAEGMEYGPTIEVEVSF